MVKKNIQQSDLVFEINKATNFLTDIELFDVFIDAEKLGATNKNLTFHLTFQSNDKTLNDTDIDSEMDNIESILNKKFKAELRLAFDQKKS